MNLEEELKKADTYFMQPTPHTATVEVPTDYNNSVFVYDGETGFCMKNVFNTQKENE